MQLPSTTFAFGLKPRQVKIGLDKEKKVYMTDVCLWTSENWTIGEWVDFSATSVYVAEHVSYKQVYHIGKAVVKSF